MPFSSPQKREAALVALAIQQPVAARAAFLQAVCGEDSALRQRLEAQLAAHEAPDGRLAAELVATVRNSESELPLAAAAEEAVGATLGPYKLREKVGEGGCGTVYVAEQEKPVRRRVALKVIKLGMDTREVIARFEAERQALAMMDHPNIAKVLDAGTTEAGRPYFVMELVRGIRITDYCDQANLSTKERLDLFIKVCQAIQHAHQKGIIHRDIKPSNILVSLHDGAPVPKVIDFGIAKATEGRLADSTVYTQLSQFLGTPAYMSPEQAEMSGLDIDTRSDIYSLGVLLYELLVGSTPFDAKELMSQGIDAMRKIIREKEPLRPSTKLSQTLVAADVRRLQSPTTEKPATEEEVRTSTRRLLRLKETIGLLKGDLDWIVMKCLEKDRTRRYETATGLAADLKRHLKNEPGAARPPSTTYRLQKAWRRNKLAFTAAGMVVLALAFGLAGVFWQWRRANFSMVAEARQRQLAEVNFQQAREVIDHMFIQVSDELAGQPRMEQFRRRLLEDALQFYEGFLRQKGDDPTVRHGAALAYFRVGSIYDRLGQFDKSLDPLGRGIDILKDLANRRPLEARDREEMANAHSQIAYAIHWLHRGHGPAIAHRRMALALWEELRREFPAVPAYLQAVGNAHVDLGNALKVADRPNEAIDQFEQALKQCQKHRSDFPNVPEDRVLLAHIHHWLGVALEYTSRLSEAEREYRTAHDLRKQLVAEQPNHGRLKHLLAHVQTYLAELLMKTGRLAEAGELLQQAVALHEKILADFPDVGDYRRSAGWGFEAFGTVLTAQGRPQEAEAALRRSVAIREKLVTDIPNVPVHHNDLATSCYHLGVLLASAGRSGEAAEIFRKALGIWERLLAASPSPGSCERHLAWMLATCPMVQFRDPSRAVTLARQSMRSEGESRRLWSLLGIAQYRAGDDAGAIESFHNSLELSNGGEGGDTQQCLFLAMIYWRKEEHEQARQWYNKAVAWIEANRPADEVFLRFQNEAAGLMGIDTPDHDKSPPAKSKETSP